jgi:hypothetical protein
MTGPEAPAGRRVRRGWSVAAAILGLGVLAALPFVVGARGEPAPGPAEPAGPVGATPSFGGSPTGRLAFVAGDPGAAGRDRLWVLDLATGAAVRGPAVDGVDEIHAAGPVNDWVVLVGRDGRQMVGWLIRDPAGRAAPAEVARGDLVSVSTDGNALLTALIERVRSATCRDASYELRRVELSTSTEKTAFRGRLSCGTLVGATLLGSDVPVIDVLHQGASEIHLLQPGDPQVLFRGLALEAASASGLLLLREDRTRELLTWPGGGTPRPLVTGSVTVPDRILASSGDGRYVVLDGTIDDAEGTWIADAAAGTAEPFPPPGYPFTDEVVGAAFAGDGTLYVVAGDRILASAGTSVFPVSLPSGVPPPIGPIAWLA